MNNLLSNITHWIFITRSTGRVSPADSVAQNLMERAEAGRGRDPHQAQELRSAAYAYLSVVR